MADTGMFPHRQRQRIVREPNLAEKQVYAKHIRAGAAASVDGGVPAVTLSTTAAAGSATTLIRTDATIIAFDATVPTTSAVGDAAATGSAALAARRDHRHAREAFASPSSVGAANASGSATTIPRSDHVHGLGAASLGSITNMTGAAGSDGVATTASRSDHMHGFAFASQAAGDLFYATSGTALARLGITAGGYIKGNAGGTAPEYSPAGQIVFPATQNASADANTLDDYEEGTWTPAVGGTATYTNQNGTYTKVGRLVVIHCRMTINVIGTGSTVTLSGNPFSANSTPSYHAGSVCYFNSLAINTIFLTVYATGSNIFFTDQGASDGGVNDQSALFGNSAQVMFSIPYYV